MITQISRKKLAVDKYTDCLTKSVNYRIYAEFWYLDTLVGENWDCLVYKDYEAVMPLPFVRKFGIKLITQPLYCQQLGVFHREEFSERIFQEFEKRLHRKLVRAYNFNEENTAMFSPKGKLKVNQVLDLKIDYLSKFDKKTKKNIKSFNNKNLLVQENYNLEALMDFKKINTSFILNSDILLKLLTALKDRNKIECYSSYYDNELIGFCIFMKSKNRFIYINSSTNSIGKKKSVATGLLYHKIKNESSFEDYLDFEGSNIPTINHFFKGFGAIENTYKTYINIFKWKL